MEGGESDPRAIILNHHKKKSAMVVKGLIEWAHITKNNNKNCERINSVFEKWS